MSQNNTVSIENIIVAKYQSIAISDVEYQSIAICIAKILKFCNKYYKKVKVLQY